MQFPVAAAFLQCILIFLIYFPVMAGRSQVRDAVRRVSKPRHVISFGIRRYRTTSTNGKCAPVAILNICFIAFDDGASAIGLCRTTASRPSDGFIFCFSHQYWVSAVKELIQYQKYSLKSKLLLKSMNIPELVLCRCAVYATNVILLFTGVVFDVFQVQ